MDDFLDEILEPLMIFIISMILFTPVIIFLFSNASVDQGVVIDKTHTEQEVSTGFTLSNKPGVIQDEAYVLHLDTDQDGEADEDLKVPQDVYDDLEIGATYESSAYPDADVEVVTK